MIVGQVEGAIALVVELLQLAQDMLRRTAPPAALAQRRDIAVNTGVGAAPGRLHGAELVQRKHRGHIQRQGFDVVDRQTGAVGIRELVQVPQQWARRILNHFPRVTPDQPRDRAGIVEVFQIVRQKLLTLATANAVNVKTVHQDAVRIQSGKGPAHDDRDARRLGLEPPRHPLECRVSCGR